MRQPPDNEIPIHVPISGVLNRTPEIVFALTSVDVYSIGVKWTIEIYKRTPTLIMGSYGFGRPETSGSTSPPYLLGFEWSDGSISSNMPHPEKNCGGLHSNGGGGGQQRSQGRLYLDHLPPEGPFSVVTAWPYFDIPEQQVTFDATRITEAARNVERLWDPVDATLKSHHDMPRISAEDAVLVMPRTGWFGEHFDSSPPPPRLDEHGNELHFQAVTTDADGNLIPMQPAPRGWRLSESDER